MILLPRATGHNMVEGYAIKDDTCTEDRPGFHVSAIGERIRPIVNPTAGVHAEDAALWVSSPLDA